MSKAQGIAQSANQGQFKNRIINGDCRIDQRNAGASVTASNTSDAIYVVDRWAYRVLAGSKISLQRSTVAPTGFTNSLLVTSLSAYTIGANEFLTVRQPIEGFNSADLGWGTASASSVTISFQVRSSLTGTFGGYISNAAANRLYVFSYTINSANTWETKNITITGDTSGTWLTDNGVGLMLGFCVAAGSNYTGSAGSWGASVIVAPTGQTNLAGTNGATFYITGVQLEKGSTATSFDYRPYGTELALCQRYYWRITGLSVGNGYPGIGSGNIYSSTTTGRIFVVHPQTMRAAPTLSSTALGYSSGTINALNASIGNTNPGLNSSLVDCTLGAACTIGHGITVYLNNSPTSYIDGSSEL